MLNLRITGAVVACELALTEKMPLQKAVVLTSRGITQSVVIVNNSAIEGAGKLPPENVFNGTLLNVILAIRGSQCYDRLNSADKKFMDDAVAEIQKQTSSPPPKK